MDRVVVRLAVVVLLFNAGCGSSPTAPASHIELFSAEVIKSSFAITVGGTLTLPIQYTSSQITNVQCASTNGDPITIAYGTYNLDWNLYVTEYHVTLTAQTVGLTTLNCTADPNASGSVPITVRPHP